MKDSGQHSVEGPQTVVMMDRARTEPDLPTIRSLRSTILSIGTLFVLAAPFFFVLHWGGIFWTENRSAVHSLVFVVAMLLAMGVCHVVYGPVRLPRLSRPARIAVALIIIGLCLFTAFVTFGNFVISGDEWTFAFQAKTLASGRFWNNPPPLGQATSIEYAWVAQGKWVGQYTPGWPAFLALFALLKLNLHLASPLLLLFSTWGVFVLVRRRAGDDSGTLAAVLFGLSPFALFNGASLYSHAMAAALIVAAVLASAESCRRDSIGWALLAGVSIGVLGLTRSASALVAVAVVVVDQVFADASRSRRLVRLAAVAAAGIPFVAALLAYQYTITGDPLKPAYWLAGRDLDHLYFDPASIKMALRHNLLGIGELSFYVAPPIFVMWLLAMAALISRRKLTAVDLVFPLGLFLYTFYPLHPGMRYGPRYFLDFWPLSVATICAALPVFWQRWSNLFRQAIILSVCYGIAVFPLISTEWWQAHQDSSDAYRVVARSGITNALVCPGSPSGLNLAIVDRNFARNPIDMTRSSVIYVNCHAASMEAMLRAFPNRTIWEYIRYPTKPSGQLRLMYRPPANH